MSFFSWLFPAAQRPSAAPRAAPARSGVKRPLAASTGEPAGSPADPRKARREQLYAVVRDAMARVGVLSAGYKFKVLSLDPQGVQFLVMIDVAPEYAGESVYGGEIEMLIVHAAKNRCAITVTSVYWRVNGQLAQPQAPRTAAVPAVPLAAARTSNAAAGAALRPGHTRPMALPPPLPPRRQNPAAPDRERPPRVATEFELIRPDEVAAFREALAAAAAARNASTGVPPRDRPGGDGAYAPAPSGFGDTRKADLSSTQYGDL